MKRFRSFWVSGLLLALPLAGFSQGTIYTSRSMFESALASNMTISFDDLPVTPSGGIGESTLATAGVTFTSPDARLFVRDRFSPSPDTGKYVQHFDSFFPVSISLPNGVTAFGADFSGGMQLKPTYNATLTVISPVGLRLRTTSPERTTSGLSLASLSPSPLRV